MAFKFHQKLQKTQNIHMKGQFNEITNLPLKKSTINSNITNSNIPNEPKTSPVLNTEHLIQSITHTLQKVNNKLRIDSKEIKFYGSNPQEKQAITIQNKGKDLIKINLTFPKTKYFKLCEQNKNFSLSAGMSKKISIKINKQMFNGDSYYYDEIFVLTQSKDGCYVDFKDKIRVEWRLKQEQLAYEELVDLKTLQIGRQAKSAITFKNESRSINIAKIRLIKDNWDNIQVFPDEFQLQPNQEVKVEFIISPQQIGAYHHKILVQQDNKIRKPIEIVYSAIDFDYCIENEAREVMKKIDFGNLLRGSKRELTFYAHNKSPNEIELKAKVKIGNSLRAESTLQSPEELGIECSSTAIQVLLKTIRIKAFSRERLTLTAETKIQQKHRLLVDRYAKTDHTNTFLKSKIAEEEKEIKEILVCEFIEVNKNQNHQEVFLASVVVKNMAIPMHAVFVLPLVKILPVKLDLGQVLKGDTAKGVVEIDNQSEIDLHLKINKIFSLDTFLQRQILQPKQKTTAEIYCKGTNIGPFHNHLEITISNLYNIKMAVNYEVMPNQRLSFRSGQESRLCKTGSNSLYSSVDKSIDFNRTLSNIKHKKNNTKYEHLTFKQAPNQSKSTHKLISCQKISLKNFDSIRHGLNKDEGSQIQNLSHFEENECESQENKMRSSFNKKYNLFVTRKIDRYVPYQQLKEHKKLQKSRNRKEYFNLVRRVAKNRKEAEEIERQIEPDNLKLISINEKVINFGKIFIYSKLEKQFVIINKSENSIIATLQESSIDSKKKAFVGQSDFQPQIISANGVAKFKIIFNALSCGKYSTTLSYTINKIHTFQLLIEADVQLVTLSISKNSLKMGYLDDVHELLLKDSFVLKNQGNMGANFSIVQSSNKLLIRPSEGLLEKGESLTVWIQQNNEIYPVIESGQLYSNKNSTSKPSAILIDERISIKIQNGNDISLKVTSIVGISQPKCLVKESKIIFGCTIVSKPKSKTFQLRNLSRNIALFQVINKDCYEFLTFDVTKGRISPEGSKQITVTYKSSLIHALNSSFQIIIRGGLIINVPIQAESIAPEISVIENEFNFGEMCCNTVAIKPINIKNQSQTFVQLFIDMRNNREVGIENLSISLFNSVSLFIGDRKVKSSNNCNRSSALEEEIIDNAIKQAGIHRIKIEAKSIYTFYLIYRPTVAGYFKFMLPLFLENFIRNESLSKSLICFVIEPKFIVEPNIVRFKKKIINDKEKSCFYPHVEYLTLRNPTDKVLKWKLDMNGQNKVITSFNSIGNSSIVTKPFKEHSSNNAMKFYFEIDEKKGELKPKESVSINVNFNPLEEGFYSYKIPLCIYNEEKGTYHQEAQIRLQGEGKYPSLYFNKKEIIMPVVPLGVESIEMFQIFNQGYQAINVKHRFEIMDSEGNIHIFKGNLNADNVFPEISVIFPDGGKLSMNKKEMFVLVKFISKKPISFTCKLELYDDNTDCRVYSLPISGTADNSLLTNFPYISDTENIFRIQAHLSDHLEQNKKKSTKQTPEYVFASQQYSIILKTNDGRNLIDRYHSVYDELTVEDFHLDTKIIKRWLNNFFREEKLTKFPEEGSKNAEILMKLLHKLTNRKEFDGNYQCQMDTNNNKIILNPTLPPLQFYEQILKILKLLGCLLNHIRPSFLLQKQEFIKEMSKDINCKNYSDYYLEKYEVISTKSWIILFYQIIQHFWLNKKIVQNGAVKHASNVYSDVQLSIIKWVQGIYESYNELQDSKQKFLSFGDYYKDCIAPIYCLLKYSIPSQKTKPLQNLNKRPIIDTQFSNNTKILYQMLQRLNIVPIIDEDEYQHCKEKEIFMFMYQLYEILPQTMPRSPSILFTCQLGDVSSRVIDIRNPSSKNVHYWIKLEGSKDFTFEEKESIVIEPKSIYPFKVDFNSRISSDQTAYISFSTKQQAEINSSAGSAMVFELKSKITGRKSIKKLKNISCPLYQSTSIKIYVQNIFQEVEYANFTVNLVQQQIQQDSDVSKLDFNQLKIKQENCFKLSQQMYMNDKEHQSDRILRSKQFCSQFQMVKIKKNSATTFDLYYTPVKLQKSKCYIIFFDPLVGQFQYEITATPQIPKPLQQIKYQTNLFINQKDRLELNLPVYNGSLIKCESLLEEQSFKSSSTTKKELKNNKSDEVYRLQLNMDPKIRDFITFPNEIVLKNVNKQGVNSEVGNKIKLEYLFNYSIKDLVLDFLLVGDPKREIQDVRRFKVSLNIVHRPLQQELIMTTTARKAIFQQIPLQNSSSKDWKVKVVMNENENGYFSLRENQLKDNEKLINKEIVIKKGQSQALTISFQPKWMGKYQSKVTIHNITTNEQLIFNVKGISEEPLSENHFYFKIDQQESSLLNIQITNPYPEKMVYKAISDISELQLPPEVILEPKETTQFNFICENISSSPQIGYIKFVDEEGRYFWYSVTIESKEKKVKQFWVQMSSQIDIQIQKMVQFKNPFNRILFFTVQLPKEYGLTSQESFQIEPQSSYQYNIKFKPIRLINTQVVIKAMSSDIGSFIYHTKLITKQFSKRKAHYMSAQVGKVGFLDFKLQNHLPIQVKVEYSLSNNNEFQIQTQEYLQADQDNVCKVKFKPASQGKKTCTLKVYGQHFPTKLFQIEATGLAPYSIQIINFKAFINESSLEIIKFVNPNPRKQNEMVKVWLSESEHGCFTIANNMKNNVWEVIIKDFLMIPIDFSPTKKGNYQAVLTVQCFHYQWKYVLKGSTNFYQTQKIKDILTTKNKQQIIKVLKITIPDYLEQGSSYFSKVQIDHQNKNLIKQLKKSMKLKINNNEIYQDGSQSNEVVVYLKFKPKRMMKEVIKLVLMNELGEGPKITHNVQLNVLANEPQKIIPIQIYSIKPLNFDLSLQTLGISIDSIQSLKMKKGQYVQLQKIQKGIRIKLKPNYLMFNRSNYYSDILMLATDEQQWIYEIRFNFNK